MSPLVPLVVSLLGTSPCDVLKHLLKFSSSDIKYRNWIDATHLFACTYSSNAKRIKPHSVQIASVWYSMLKSLRSDDDNIMHSQTKINDSIQAS